MKANQARSTLEIANSRLKAKFIPTDDGILQEYFAKKSGQWIKVVTSLRPPSAFPDHANQLYNSRIDPVHRFLPTEILNAAGLSEQAAHPSKVILRGESGGTTIEQSIELNGEEDFFHIEVKMTLAGRPAELEYLFSLFEMDIDGKPDYTHAPSYKRGEDYIIADRVFFSPAAVVQQGGMFAALVPDLDIINENKVYSKNVRKQKHRRILAVPQNPEEISMPVVLDLELQSGISDKPLLGYGTMDYISEQHVYWRHENTNREMVRELSSSTVRYGMDLFIRAEAPPHRGYQRISQYLWDRYAVNYLPKPKPQAMPFADYARVCYPASFAYKGFEVKVLADGDHQLIHHNPHGEDLESWQQWEIDGTPVGGLRLSASQWYYFIYFASWWNNVCDATGMYFWGRHLNDPSLIDKARRIVNFALTAPQKEGIFPAYYNLDQKRWIPSLWGLPMEGYDPNEKRAYFDWDNNSSYQTASASVTAGYLLSYRRICEDHPAILPFVKRFGDFLIAQMQPNGCVPAWFNEQVQPLPSLRWNADGGAHAWVLSELYRATHENKYLDTAKKMAKFMIEEVLPGQKWFDFETFYSCATKPETFFDKQTGQPGRNTMSMSWALQGFTSLYEVTGRREYLEAALAVADYAAFFQTVWAPHYVITAYPFGGFSSQIGDAEWLDQRDHRFAGILAHLGLLSGRQDLIERAVAATRASLTIVNLPQHIENGIYEYPTFPIGLGPENIDHEGAPQTPHRSGPSWCEVGGLVAAADVMRLLGGAYINVAKNLALGVDGVNVKHFELQGRTLSVELENRFAALPLPYHRPFEIDLKVEGLPDEKTFDLLINGHRFQKVTAAELFQFPIKIQP